jgi:predicted O-linked N-acetylglucosamine transferase (SPINDLY family)
MSIISQPQSNAIETAKAPFRAILQADPNSLLALFNLGKLCLEQHYLEEARNYLTQVLQIQPTHADAWFYLGRICRLRGETAHGIALSYRAYELNPKHAAAHAQALLCMRFLPHFTETQIFVEHLRWANAHAHYGDIPVRYQNSLEPERKLKIGYLFSNEHRCPMADFFEPLLAYYNSECFEISCYALSMKQDAATLRFAEYADCWHNVSSLTPVEIAATIQQDAIDILVDLAGHNDHNSILVLSRKPAPIQATYPSTTGMAQVDYCFSDPCLDPLDQPPLASEELLRLSASFLCYLPVKDAPNLEPPPSQKEGYITFGCTHALEKMSDATVSLWAQILLAVPEAKLLLVDPAFQAEEICEQYHGRFGQHGIARERLFLLSDTTTRFSVYAKIDIFLDSFPSNGVISSCDALWMGVPVITLASEQKSSRISASILSAAGLWDLIATSCDSYIQKAVELAGNAELLEGLRKHLREQLLHSALCNGKHFTAEIESLYRQIWQRWCVQDERHQTYKPTNCRLAQIERQLISPERGAQWQSLATLCRPDFADLHLNLGLMWCHLGQPAQAEHYFRCAVQCRADFPEAWSNLGMALFAQDKIEEAVTASQTALQWKPDFEVAYQNLGHELSVIYRYSEALEYLQKALALNPNHGPSYRNIGQIYQFQGRAAEAIAYFRQSALLEPNSLSAQTGLIGIMLYAPECSVQECFAQLKHCAQMHVQDVPPPVRHTNDRNPSRRLRIGYISPDLHAHSVASFFEPMLTAHHEQAVETFCYAEEFYADEVTERLQRVANHWRSTCGLSDKEVSRMVRADQIDILVDLAGYSKHSRIRAMAYKPAPVQATYLGYPNTTGMPQIDYRLIDAWTDPPDQPSLCTETLVRLEDGFLCYQPPTGIPENEPPPVLNRGYVTFGSFNVLAKLSVPAARLWAKILHSVPNSRLFLKSLAFVEPLTQEYWKAFFEKEGIHSDRLDLVGWVKDRSTHLSLYNRVDIALDPFPYNGTTTTCEALWMGVPVVTLVGNSHISRIGVSLLSTLQLEELIASSEEEYLEIAVQLSQDHDRLTLFRETIRSWMSVSPLCDSEAFAFKVEAAYRQIWRTWCENS